MTAAAATELGRMSATDLAEAIRTRQVSSAEVVGFGQLMKGWTVMDRLSEIKVPTLVMAGRDDFVFPPEHQGQLAAGIPNARLEIIERRAQPAR